MYNGIQKINFENGLLPNIGETFEYEIEKGTTFLTSKFYAIEL